LSSVLSKEKHHIAHLTYAPPAKVVSIEECEKFIQKCHQQIEEEAFNKLHNLCNASSVPKIQPQQAKIRDMMCSRRPRVFSTGHVLKKSSFLQPFRSSKSIRNPDEILEKVQNKFDKRENTYLNRNFKTLLPDTILEAELTQEVEKLIDGCYDRDKEAKDGKKYCEICNENYDDLFRHQKLTKHEKKWNKANSAVQCQIDSIQEELYEKFDFNNSSDWCFDFGKDGLTVEKQKILHDEFIQVVDRRAGRSEEFENLPESQDGGKSPNSICVNEEFGTSLAVGKILKIRGPSPTLITPKKISKWPLTDQFEKLTPRARRFCRDETDSKILIHKEFEDEWKEEQEKENKQVWRITRVPSEGSSTPCFTLFSQAINKVNKRKPDPIHYRSCSKPKNCWLSTVRFNGPVKPSEDTDNIWKPKRNRDILKQISSSPTRKSYLRGSKLLADSKRRHNQFQTNCELDDEFENSPKRFKHEVDYC